MYDPKTFLRIYWSIICDLITMYVIPFRSTLPERLKKHLKQDAKGLEKDE